MHILFISNNFPRPHEPGGPRPWQMASHWINKGHRVTVITNMRHYMSDQYLSSNHWRFIKRIVQDGMTIYEVLTISGKRKSIFKRILHYVSFTFMALLVGVNIKNVDIVYVRTPPILANFCGWFLARLKRKPYVLEIGDLHPEEAISLGLVKSKVVILLWKKWENFFRQAADLIVAIVPGIKNLLVQKGLAANKIIVATNAYDPPSEKESRSLPKEINDVLKALKGKFILIYTGSMGLAIALETTIKAAKLIQDQGYKDICFLYVGEGDKKGFLKETCQQLSIHNCIFCDPVPRESIYSILTKADVAFHSFYRDPFHGYNLPNKIFDYLGSGKPIIYAGTGDVAKILQTAKCGIVVPPENPLAFAEATVYLYTHKEEAKMMGLQGREYVLTHFNREHILERLDKRLSELCNYNH